MKYVRAGEFPYNLFRFYDIDYHLIPGIKPRFHLLNLPYLTNFNVERRYSEYLKLVELLESYNL